jgi:hypothetical protein
MAFCEIFDPDLSIYVGLCRAWRAVEVNTSQYNVSISQNTDDPGLDPSHFMSFRDKPVVKNFHLVAKLSQPRSDPSHAAVI